MKPRRSDADREAAIETAVLKIQALLEQVEPGQRLRVLAAAAAMLGHDLLAIEILARNAAALEKATP